MPVVAHLLNLKNLKKRRKKRRKIGGLRAFSVTLELNDEYEYEFSHPPGSGVLNA